MRTETEIFSIFGEIEAVVATQMGFKRIEPWDIPLSAKFNEIGQQAKFAVVVPGKMLAEFEERIAKLRA